MCFPFFVFPVDGDVDFCFLDGCSRNTTSRLNEEQQHFPYRAFMDVITYILSAIRRLFFAACCVACPAMISQCYSNPSERWLVHAAIDNPIDCRYHKVGVCSSSCEKQKREMRTNAARFSFQPYSEPKTACQECPICLYEYFQDEEVVLSRHCRHAFHEECLATWLCGHSSCPCCRAPL